MSPHLYSDERGYMKMRSRKVKHVEAKIASDWLYARAKFYAQGLSNTHICSIPARKSFQGYLTQATTKAYPMMIVLECQTTIQRLANPSNFKDRIHNFNFIA